MSIFLIIKNNNVLRNNISIEYLSYRILILIQKIRENLIKLKRQEKAKEKIKRKKILTKSLIFHRRVGRWHIPILLYQIFGMCTYTIHIQKKSVCNIHRIFNMGTFLNFGVVIILQKFHRTLLQKMCLKMKLLIVLASFKTLCFFIKTCNYCYIN